MSHFEPKSDASDFEIATSERPPGGRISTTPAADMTIRLWRADPTGNSSALTWMTDSVLVYMIADLVAASHGKTGCETPAAMTANFSNTNQALVAAKRIQLSILEFVACQPGDYLGAALLIHPPATAGFSSAMAQSALRVAEPGQIILSEGVSGSLQDLPGIELRPVAALTTGGSEHAGLSELLWASPEHIAKIREAARATPTGVSANPQVGATIMVNAPSAGARSDRSSDRSGTAQQKITQRPVDDGFTAARDEAFEAGLADFQQSRSFTTRARLIVGVLAILVIGVGVAMFYPSSASKVRQRPPETQTVEPQTAPTPAPPPVETQPAPPVPQVPDAHAKAQRPGNKPPASKLPRAKVVMEQAQDQENAKKAVDTPIQGFEGNSTYDGMTQKDIPRLLQWARSDAGNGRYEKAGQEYRVILQLQPNNPDAKEGLRKLQLAQQPDQ